MALEPIRTTKAPKDWRMSSDQQRQIANDSRLQRMSRDDLYFYFNQPKTPAKREGGGGGARPAPRANRDSGGPASGLFGWVDTITNALRGK